MSRSRGWIQASQALARLCLVLAVGVATAACSSDEQPAPPYVPIKIAKERTCADDAFVLEDDNEPEPEASCEDAPEGTRCFGSWAADCDGEGNLRELKNCRLERLTCMTGKCNSGQCGGCVECTPGTTRCGDGGERYRCNDDGSGFDLAEVCDEAAGERCSVRSNKCENLCEAASRARSYTGCEYYAVATANSQLEHLTTDDDGLCQPFPFAVVIANTEGVPADVRVSSPGFDDKMLSVGPGMSETVRLPCNRELKGEIGETLTSAHVRDAAHRIVSNIPITVYQFNPLEFEGTVAETGDSVYSYTNDASLLLPVHAMTGNYRVMSRATLQNHREAAEIGGVSFPAEVIAIPGFVAITGVEEEPTEVLIRSSAYTRASLDGRIPALRPGQALRVTLGRGEVVQLISEAPENCRVGRTESSFFGDTTYCKVSREYDLTGTEITAQGKVSVIAGHDCAFVPYDRYACDHLEESMMPLESWGTDFTLTVTATTNCNYEAPNMFRVLAAHDDTTVSFIPEVAKPVTLMRGDYVEFQSTRSFQLHSSKAVMVAQLLLGQDFEGGRRSSSLFMGDPSLALSVPMEQWRFNYPFLTPSTYRENFINVVARSGSTVLLDGRVLGGFDPIEGTNMMIGRVRVEAGSHMLESSTIFGFLAYGFAPYTSYMVPGGLDLHEINAPD